jgi:hypothetical protein
MIGWSRSCCTPAAPTTAEIWTGLTPSRPDVGEEITLGTGTLFTDTDADSDTGAPTAIGLKPDDGRTAWLDPRALYRCHSQTVRLELRDDSRPEGHDTPRAA